MKLTKMILTLGIAAMALPGMAQTEGQDLTNKETRYKVGYTGPAKDEFGFDIEPVQAVESYYGDFVNQDKWENWKDMYGAWKWLMTNCPIANTRLYARGPVMLQKLIQSEETSAADKKVYLKEMMDMFDTRIKLLDKLNATVPEGKKGRVTKGDVLIAKANYYHICGYGVDENYTHNSIYDMYAKAIKDIREEGGREVRGLYIQYFFSESYELYKASKEYYGEQFLNDYLSSTETCEKMLQLAKEETDADAAMKIVEEYDKPLAVIQTVFAQSGAADRETLIALFTPKVEANKTNVDYLNSTLNILASNDCDDTEVYYTAAKYAYDLQPSYLSAIGTAQYYSGQKNTAEATARYKKALELCQTDATRASISLKIATAMTNSGDFAGATEYLNKAVQYNADLQGRAYYSQANMAVKQHKYDDAIALYNKASETDITLTGTCNRMVAKLREVKAAQAENARQQKEYNDFKAKQKAEEDFWKNGK